MLHGRDEIGRTDPVLLDRPGGRAAAVAARRAVLAGHLDRLEAATMLRGAGRGRRPGAVAAPTGRGHLVRDCPRHARRAARRRPAGDADQAGSGGARRAAVRRHRAGASAPGRWSAWPTATCAGGRGPGTGSTPPCRPPSPGWPTRRRASATFSSGCAATCGPPGHHWSGRSACRLVLPAIDEKAARGAEVLRRAAAPAGGRHAGHPAGRPRPRRMRTGRACPFRALTGHSAAGAVQFGRLLRNGGSWRQKDIDDIEVLRRLVAEASARP